MEVGGFHFVSETGFMASLTRPEPINGAVIIELYIYNQVLGYGKAISTVTIKPDPANPGKFRAVVRNAFTFPGNIN